jgi:hypothetical protein
MWKSDGHKRLYNVFYWSVGKAVEIVLIMSGHLGYPNALYG